ncbi:MULTISPECIES: type VI secretion system contractile sheath small subunit [Shewanella]|jgi:type VI secretion system protein ImpB|uniref:Type VI secretion system-associated protein n=4 Tax=Bacteria TaxID=2 RepID=A0A5N5TUX6_9GAMM|nr:MULTISPECIES: type VI secretion system contractile sheath small subunit [Shewanella]AXQ14821.1 type VI secretion system-associated protein [Shewanella algae]AYV12588.1 type VI secretion system contractile sheath small subunit [Shewanella algae]MBC8798153.1 type VI secretion system contractile sheath small subunit [Shewanella algae]MBO2546642.1 type VI secretion system contractile sheath small subunit [Shewanella algae]MBO2551218.1 type VI secretion system contractile sheath small subunit [S
MAKDGSVAPKERINIKYVPSTGDQQSEMELPLKLLVLGDFKGHPEDSQLEERKTVQVDKSNFESVMKEANLSISATVDNKLTDEDGAELSVDLKFDSLKDFSPDSIGEQVPEIQKLIELREALVALKGPLGNIPAFRAKLQELIATEESREKLLSELQQMEQ